MEQNFQPPNSQASVIPPAQTSSVLPVTPLPYQLPKSTKVLLTVGAIIVLGGLAAIGYFYLPGRANISTNITDAKITLDGANWSFQKSIWLKRGKHTIEANRDGYLLSTQVFEVKPLLSTVVNISLNKLTTLSPTALSSNPEEFKIDDLASQRIQAAGAANYIYLDEDQKAIFQFANNASAKIMDLSFLSAETLDKFKWSADQKMLFIRSLKDEAYLSRLVTLSDKLIKDLGTDTLDVAFNGSEYFLLKKSDEASIISDKSGQVAQISEVKNNLEYDGSNFYIYNTVVDDNAGTAYFCQGSNCQKFSISGDVTNLFASNNHAVAITLGDNYSLYNITTGKTKLVDSNVAPLGSWSNNNFFYLKNGDSCAIKKYDFSSSNLIYQNSNICGIDDFSVAQDKLFYRQALTAYQLDLK